MVNGPFRPSERRVDGEDREDRQQEPVCQSVDDSSPDHGADELQSVRPTGRLLRLQDEEGKQAGKQRAEGEADAPATSEHRAERLVCRVGPEDEEPDDADCVDAVVDIPRQIEDVREHEWHCEREDKASAEPPHLIRYSRGRASGESSALNDVSTHGTSFLGVTLASCRVAYIGGMPDSVCGFSEAWISVCADT